MSGGETWPWIALLLLGAWHGVNPGMGWLFAVALGLQERRGRAVWRALPPLAIGHAFAVGGAIAAAALVGLVLPTDVLKWSVAAVLLSFGVYRLFRRQHPSYGGMRVGARQLALWSFLMATAHGAGLMVLPFVLPDRAAGGGVGGHATHLAGMVPPHVPGLAAALLHTAAYLAVTGLVAWLVYRYLGLRRLRTLWWNTDIVWALALIATALATPLL